MLAVEGRYGKGTEPIPWIPTDPRRPWLPCALAAVLLVTVGVGFATGVAFWGGGGGIVTPPPSVTPSPRPSASPSPRPSVTASPSPRVSPSVSPSVSISPSPSVSFGIDVALIMSPLGAVVPVGQTVQFTAVAYRDDGTLFDLTGENVAWTSSSPSIATVSNDPLTAGQITGVTVGQVNVNVAVEGSTPYYALIYVVEPEFVDCAPEYTGSSQGMILISDPGEHADEFGFDPATMGWQQEVANGTIHLTNGPPGLEDITATFDENCNYETFGVGDFGGLTDIPYAVQGSYGSPPGLKIAITIGPNGELGTPPTVYSN